MITNSSFFHPTPFLCNFVNYIREEPPISDDIRDLFIKGLEKEKGFLKFPTEAQVLILSKQDDLESDLIGLVLLSKDIDYFRINIEDIPNDIKVSC